MVVCTIALVVFAILGIFSARYRKLAKEAFDCTFKKLTFKPCDTGLDTRIKAGITTKLMRWPKAAKWMHKNFDTLTTILFMVMIVSTVWSGYEIGKGVYNYEKYGNCNGPDSSAFCIFNIANAEKPRTGALYCNATDCTCITPEINCTIKGGNYTPCSGATCSCPK
jgi:hypothetical protein